jgi:LPS sulfotransferase NodH
MLEGIETGYEERYDFPHRAAAPERTYLLASVPRTGSTFVSHLLWRTGCLGAPLEYLNFLPTGPYHFAAGDPRGQVELWRSALHRRTSPNGVFGVKCFSLQLRELQKANPSLLLEVMATLLPRHPPARVVLLKRRDRTAHAISYARASLSGIWRKDQEAHGGVDVPYSAAAVQHARALLDQQEADWQALFDELRIEPLVLWYEDVLERPDAEVRRVAAFLGVTLDPAAEVSVPRVEKQSESDPRLWAERYARGNP